MWPFLLNIADIQSLEQRQQTKCVRGMKEQLLKTSGTDVLSSRKKLRKIYLRYLRPTDNARQTNRQ